MIFIGSFRPIFVPELIGIPVCPICGNYAGSSGAQAQVQKEHYDAGHFDIPHYRTITEKTETNQKCYK